MLSYMLVLAFLACVPEASTENQSLPIEPFGWLTIDPPKDIDPKWRCWLWNDRYHAHRDTVICAPGKTEQVEQ